MNSIAENLNPTNSSSLLTREPLQFDLIAYLRVIYHRKWTVLAVPFVFCMLAVVAVLSMTPIYRSTATLLIESDSINVVSVEEIYGIDSSRQEYYKTQFEILNSRNLAERVIRELRLETYPEFTKATPPVWDVRQYLLPSTDTDGDDDWEMQRLLDLFTERLSITPIRNTQLVDINFESEDPVLAPLVANTLGEAYINSHLEARLDVTQKASSWLTDRLSVMQADLEGAERRLREFQERENLVDVQGVKTLTVQELNEQTQRLVDARKTADAARSQLEAAGDTQGAYNSRWEALSIVLNDELSQALKQEEADDEENFEEVRKRYGPKHPKYISAESKLNSAQLAFQNRVRKVVRGLEDIYDRARADQASIERNLNRSKQEIQSINRKSYELSQLQRKVNTNRQLYDMFFQRFQETSGADFAAANARFVDKAVKPYKPVKPRKALIVALAGIFGLGLAIVLVFVREALDNTVRAADDVESKLGQGVLGVVPLEKEMRRHEVSVSQLYLKGEHHAFAESLRSLRTSVVLSGLDKPHKITVVTSSVPGEGKTTISSNLALALGQMERVLLIDADMRRPSLANDYGLPSGTVGLAEVVAGSEPLDSCILELDDLGIDLLPAGTVPPNPLDLLSSSRFSELLDNLKGRYERIIIDSAPTQAVSDSMVLSTKADALIYVVKADNTPVSIVINGLKRLRSVNAPIIGVVLNHFDADVAMRYGYQSGKYGYYGHGYASKSYT